ncbi:MAG: S8 family serine peptidase [Akkermansiaceae bacterium]|nr:S8 family serine peptidase [Verrucomicrobiales bacterium]
MPHSESFQIEPAALRATAGSNPVEWIRARRNDGSTNSVQLGSRVVLQVNSADALEELTGGGPLTLSRTISSNVFIFQAPDAMTAVREAARLAALPQVRASYPVLRHEGNLHGPYAPPPTDFYYLAQWPLEHRVNGIPAGVDLNVRAAWPFTMGEGVTVAVADTGVELNHRELLAAVSNSVHHNFVLGNTNGSPVNRSSVGAHGTEVAGLISSGLNDYRIVGVAPGAKLASWVIFDAFGALASDEQLSDMYQYQPGNVSVQNHSWGGGNGVAAQVGPTLLEKLGIENAVTLGRGGLGSIIVRSAGNDRTLSARADDDGYPANPYSIAVGAVNVNGKIASYSEPGACVLVGAPSGDPASAVPGLFSTDLIGTDGAGTFSYCPWFNPDCENKDLSDYVFFNQGVGMQGFNGTSAAAPHITGIAALMLSVNPGLGYRDVQQILALASRHFDFADPDLRTNGAGFVVSHNDGFGVPDASRAVRLAQSWSNRPALAKVSVLNNQPAAIPDDMLRVEVSGAGVPVGLSSIHCLPSLGIHADEPTALLELVDAGLAGTVPAVNLTNKAALILRGDFDFSVKIANVAAAGAAFAIIYNYSTNVDANQGGDRLTAMAATDNSPIPAVFIGHSDGEALKALSQTNAAARARIRLQGVEKIISVNSTLICEQVGLRVQTDHTRRGDLRITLVSPQGTRSVLQAFNLDTGVGPVDWTYWSTHHFFESSAGDWKVCITDEGAGSTGAVQSVSLIVHGTQINDTDRDGLDDAWESAHFGSLAYNAKADPEGDGSWNAREQVLAANPAGFDSPLALDLSRWELAGTRLNRLTWPSSARYNYAIYDGTNLSSLNLVTNVAGTFPETEWLGPPFNTGENRFFKIFASPGQ